MTIAGDLGMTATLIAAPLLAWWIIRDSNAQTLPASSKKEMVGSVEETNSPGESSRKGEARRPLQSITQQLAREKAKKTDSYSERRSLRMRLLAAIHGERSVPESAPELQQDGARIGFGRGSMEAQLQSRRKSTPETVPEDRVAYRE